MSQSGLSAPASPDPDMSGSSSRPESRSSISSSSIVDQAAESSRLSSNLDDIDKKSESGEVIGLDENAQSGGLLDEQKKELMQASPGQNSKTDGDDSLEMVSDDDMEANESCKDLPNPKSPLNQLDPLKDTELDFEEDLVDEDNKKVADEGIKKEDREDGEECDEEKELHEEGDDEKEEGEELEEGEVSSEEDVGKHARMEPRPVCRFYSKGNCTWGSNCRFVHPGVLDKGNYNMFAPARPGAAHNPLPSAFERGYEHPPLPAGLPPSPAEWASAPPRPAPSRSAARHPSKSAEAPRSDAGGAESAWERGLRQAKEMLKKSSQRKETDIDFEEKKLNLGLGEEDLDKENDYYTRPASPVHHADIPPPPFEELEPEPYSKYPQPPAEGRWPSSRYPPSLYHPPRGYPPYPYSESRRGFPEPEMRDREYYKAEGYDRQYYGYKQSERDGYSSSGKPPLPPPAPPQQDKRWQDERYVEVIQAPAQRSRSDEWWDPWMRSRSPGSVAVAGANTSSGKSAGASGAPAAGATAGRRRSYSSGSSYSSSSSTSSSSSSSYSSSSRSSSRSSATSRSSSRSKSSNSRRRAMRKHKQSERVSKGSKVPLVSASKHKALALSSSTTSSLLPSMSKPTANKKPSQGLEKPRTSGIDRSPNRNRSPPSKSRPSTKGGISLTAKSHGRPRSSSPSSSSSEWDTSSRSSAEERTRHSNRGRRDFAERKELRPGNSPPPTPASSANKGRTGTEPPKAPESKQQIKLTLKSAAPPLRKITSKFDDDSDDDGDCGSRNWEKEKAVPIIASSPAASIAKPTRKRGAESPPSAPLAKVVAASINPKADKGSKKSAATRREELLKQLKAVEEAIARKRSKLT